MRVVSELRHPAEGVGDGNEAIGAVVDEGRLADEPVYTFRYACDVVGKVVTGCADRSQRVHVCDKVPVSVICEGCARAVAGRARENAPIGIERLHLPVAERIFVPRGGQRAGRPTIDRNWIRPSRCGVAECPFAASGVSLVRDLPKGIVAVADSLYAVRPAHRGDRARRRVVFHAPGFPCGVRYVREEGTVVCVRDGTAGGIGDGGDAPAGPRNIERCAEAVLHAREEALRAVR